MNKGIRQQIEDNDKKAKYEHLTSDILEKALSDLLYKKEKEIPKAGNITCWITFSTAKRAKNWYKNVWLPELIEAAEKLIKKNKS